MKYFLLHLSKTGLVFYCLGRYFPEKFFFLFSVVVKLSVATALVCSSCMFLPVNSDFFNFRSGMVW